MSIIYGLLVVLEIIVSALLIPIIFLQKSKGGMGGSAFGGGGGGDAIFGSRMGNVLTKATVVLAIIFLANTVLLTMLTARRESGGSVTDSIPAARDARPAGTPGAGPVATPPSGMSQPEPIAAPEGPSASTKPVEPMTVPDAPMVDVPVEAPAPEASVETGGGESETTPAE